MFAAIFIPGRDMPENSMHAALLDCAASFSPRVEDTAIDTAVLDLSGLERLFGSPAEIATQIHDQAMRLGLHPHVAIAANPDAAIYAARGIAGQQVIPAGTERQQLSALPLSLLTAEAPFLETMTRWGLRTFGEFAALPATQIAERLGQDGVRLHTLARGASARPLQPHREPLRFEETMTLDDAITLLEPLRFILTRLLDQICRRLRLRRRATQEVHVRLDADERVLRLPLPASEPGLLVELLMLHFEARPPQNAVMTIAVEAIPSRPRAIQNGLFVPLAPEPEQLELTLARIAHVVGEHNVGSPELLDSHRPDAFHMHRFNAQPLTHCPAPAPWPALAFRRFRPPRAAQVRLRHGVPCWLACDGSAGQSGSIITASGPWKSSGEWWQEGRWAREEWDIRVQTAQGIAVLRIYCDPQRWFVEGVYD